jgi:hypothetical protein
MLAAIEGFRRNIGYARNLGGLHAALVNMTTTIVDASDLLRAQHVLSVSALDCFIHEVVLLGMLETFDGARSPTDAYKRFRVPFDTVSSSKSVADLRACFESEIRAQHSYLAFQQPDRIADAVRLMSPVVLWEAVGTRVGLDAKNVKDRIRLIVERRNKISHEADIDPSFPGQRWPIHASDVDATLDFLCLVSEAVYLEVT